VATHAALESGRGDLGGNNDSALELITLWSSFRVESELFDFRLGNRDCNESEGTVGVWDV